MLLLEKNNLLDKNIFLLMEDDAFTYEEVFHAGDELFDNNHKELILILCDKNVETIITYVSALRHNKVPLLIDRNYKKGLIESFIDNYSPHYIFASQDDQLGKMEYEIHREILGGFIYKRKQLVEYEIAADLALMIPTSGSTGDPKCVRFSSNNIDSCTRSICEYLDFDQNRVAISFLPIHYSYGLSVLHNCIYKRAQYAVSKRTILDTELWDDIEKFKVTDFSGVPFSMKILRRIKLNYNKLSSLKYVTQAGGYLPEVDSRYFFKEFSDNNIRYFTMYGQTEASPRISYLSPEFSDTKAGSAGQVISCGQAYIAETGEASGVGELVYKGPNVALGYAANFNDLKLEDEFNGSLVTGDIVEIDEDGFIKIIGRTKRFIKVNGISVNLDKIEKDLNETYSSIVVIGKDDKIIALTESNDPIKIKQFIIDKYNFNKINIKSRAIEIIPLNASGKTDYKLLNETYS